MKIRSLMSLALAMTLVGLPFTTTIARDVSSTQACPVVTETQQQLLERSEQRAAIAAADAQVYNPLTQEALVDAVAAIHNNDIQTDAQADIVAQYVAYSQPQLSDAGLAVQDALLQEMELLGILAHELDTRDGELTVPDTHPDFPIYVSEADAIFLSLPGNVGSQRFIFTLGAIIAVVACDFKIIACAEDTNEELEDCVEDRICEDGECTNKQCCADKAKSDLKNCLISCGLNGPDGDYANCCE